MPEKKKKALFSTESHLGHETSLGTKLKNDEFNLGSNLKWVSVKDGALNERIEDVDLGTCSIGF